MEEIPNIPQTEDKLDEMLIKTAEKIRETSREIEENLKRIKELKDKQNGEAPDELRKEKRELIFSIGGHLDDIKRMRCSLEEQFSSCNLVGEEAKKIYEALEIPVFEICAEDYIQKQKEEIETEGF